MLWLNSYAKLNLFLNVLRLRKDKFHNLETLFARISLADKLILKLRRDKQILVSCDKTSVPSGAGNLAYKAAKLLQDKFRIKSGVEIKILKRIPVGAGLGGGSSNAASALLALNRLWKLNLSRRKLCIFARQLGSDVPFFVYNAPFALAAGRGEQVKPLLSWRSLRLWHILVVPKLSVPTPLIYRKYDEYLSRKIVKLTVSHYDVKILTLALRKKDFGYLQEVLFNSLEPVTQRLFPEVALAKQGLKSCGLKTILMSGSGPAVFGIASSKKEAEQSAARLRRENPTWQVFAVRTV